MEQDLITNLPHEVLVLISRFLSAKDLGSLAQCCRFLRFFLFANEVWTPLLSSTFPLLETDPQLDARAQYKLFLQYGKNFRRGKVRVRMIGQPHLVRGREETVFCAKNLLKNTFVSGGSVPVVTVSDISTGNKKFEFNFQSGLAMGLDIDSGLFACGGFQGSVSIVHGMDSDMQRFLHNQSARQLKFELAQRKRGWQDLNEKTDLIEKLLNSFGADEIPTFHASTTFMASPAGLVDIMVEHDNIYTAGWDAKIVKWHVTSRTASPDRVCEFEGHTEGINKVIRGGSSDVLLSAGSDGCVRLWDETTTRSISSFEVSPNWVWCLDLVDPNVFVCGGVGRELVSFDIRARRASLRLRFPAEISGLSYSQAFGFLASACFDGSVRLHDLRATGNNATLVTRVAASSERLTRCVINNDRVVVGSFDGTLKILDFADE